MPVQTVLVLAIALMLAAIATWRAARAWVKYRGRRVIACPENQKPAGVVVDARHAAVTALGKAPDLRLFSCSRWPERAGCGQACLQQIEASPEDCLVRTIASRWYQGKVCASCGKPFGEIEWSLAKPAILRADKSSVEWNQVPAEQLLDMLAASLPVCFACHQANAFVREHPELVVDRHRRVAT